LVTCDYVAGSVIVVSQVLGANGLASMLFYLTFAISALLWLCTLVEQVEPIDLVAIVTIVVASANVVANSILTMTPLSFDYLKKLMIFACTVIYLTSCTKARVPARTLRRVPYMSFAVGAVLLASYVLWNTQMHLLGGLRSTYLTFGFTNPNLTALFLACFIMILVLEGMRARQWWLRSAFLVMAAIEVIFLYETQSRNALLAIGVFLVVAILAAMLGPGRIVLHKWLFAFVSVFPLLFVGAYMAFVGNEDLMQAFSFLSGEGKGLGSRTFIWQDALDRFWESPIFGAYSQLSNGSGMSQMHNTHMDILASYGIVVLILTCVFLYLIMARSWDGGNRATRVVGVVAFECVIMLCVGEAALFAGGLAVYVFMGYFLLYANQASESLPGEVGEA
jgi:O-antigen ligase